MKLYPNNDDPPQLLVRSYALLFVLLPWSVELQLGTWNLQVPAEPLLVWLSFYLAWIIRQEPFRLTPVFSSFPFVVGMCWVLWMAISASFSSMSIVSWKYWLVASGHFWVFGLGMALWPQLWQRVLPLLVYSLLGLASYTLAHHGFYHFRSDQALLAPMPFFPDHTMYSAVLAILVFFVLAAATIKAPWNYLLAAFFVTGVLISTCRASALSLVLTGWVFAGYYCWKRLVLLAPVALLLATIGGIVVIQNETNVRVADVSFQERLNRWDAAAAMLANRPWTGFGPGTFQFQFVAFQKPEKTTRISVKDSWLERGPDTYGRGGGAHAEYWQAASELGWPGLVIWLTLFSSVLWLGLRQAIVLPDAAARWQALFISLGLLTFFIHALVNNFLHDGRVAALVWGGIALLASRTNPRAVRQ